MNGGSFYEFVKRELTNLLNSMRSEIQKMVASAGISGLGGLFFGGTGVGAGLGGVAGAALENIATNLSTPPIVDINKDIEQASRTTTDEWLNFKCNTKIMLPAFTGWIRKLPNVLANGTWLRLFGDYRAVLIEWGATLGNLSAEQVAEAARIWKEQWNKCREYYMTMDNNEYAKLKEQYITPIVPGN